MSDCVLHSVICLPGISRSNNSSFVVYDCTVQCCVSVQCWVQGVRELTVLQVIGLSAVWRGGDGQGLSA